MSVYDMNNTERMISQFSDKLASKAHSMLMSHNWRAVLKNAYDSLCQYIKEKTMKKLTIALIGCGARGKCYTQYALDNPDKFQVVACSSFLDQLALEGELSSNHQ